MIALIGHTSPVGFPSATFATSHLTEGAMTTALRDRLRLVLRPDIPLGIHRDLFEVVGTDFDLETEPPRGSIVASEDALDLHGLPALRALRI